MALLICAMPLLCSPEAAAISAIMSDTRLTDCTISCMVLPATSTCFVPSVVLLTESAINSLISFAADDERCAKFRTSAATTAKPRPCSPARAASTAAFNAKIFV